MEECEKHISYHIVSGRLIEMTDDDLRASLAFRIKKLIKQKFGINDIQNKGKLFGINQDKNIKVLDLEELVSVAIELGVTDQQLQTDNSLFHVIAPDGTNHTFCIHDFETNQKEIYCDFAHIIIRIFELEPNTVAPVILSNVHDSYLNEGIIFVHYDEDCGPVATPIQKDNPLFNEIISEYQ